MAMERDSSKAVYRFGVFEASSDTGELRKRGRRLALQGQPLQVLLMLLERPGEIVTRNEIQQRLWSDGTFVDFEHGLNSAINKVRDALGDSAANPRFIETLAKRGYRFIAPVEAEVEAQNDANSSEVPPAPDQSQPGSEPSNPYKPRLLTTVDEVPRVPHPVSRSLFSLLQVMYLAFYIAALAGVRDVEEVVASIAPGHFWVIWFLMITAAIGIPTRLYLLSGIAFRSPALPAKFLRLFPLIFLFDEIWALAPFLLFVRIGFGLALAATAALVYAPFAQRSLILMISASRTASPVSA